MHSAIIPVKRAGAVAIAFKCDRKCCILQLCVCVEEIFGFHLLLSSLHAPFQTTLTLFLDGPDFDTIPPLKNPGNCMTWEESNTHAHAHAHTHTHTHMHTHANVHTHTHTHSLMLSYLQQERESTW